MKIIDSINSQFKLLNSNNNYYVIDVDSNLLAYFFPMLVWILPLKSIEIDKHLYEKLIKKESRKNNYIVLVVIGFIIGKVLYEITKSLFSSLEYSIEARIFIFIGTIAILLIIRIIISVQNKAKFLRQYSLNRFDVSIRIPRKNIKTYYLKQQSIRLFIFYCIALVLTYVYIFISLDMLVILIIGFIIFYFLNRNENVPYESEIIIEKG